MAALGFAGMATESRDVKKDEPRDKVACPYCRCEDTERVALFGSVLLTSQYYCRHCHSAFEVVKG